MTEELVRCLEAVTLRCGKWTAQVSPRYGMNTLALCWNGRAVLRSPESLEEFLRLPEGYGTPPLLPANRTKDGTFEFEGRKYTLPINDRFHSHKHGYVHTSAFTVTSRSESAVEGILENHGALYPFPFRMTVCTALEEDGLHQDYTLTNIGKSDMPVIFAIHASFVAPEKCRIPVEKVWLADERCLPTMELGPLPEELKPYIHSFAAFSSCKTLFTVVCSYGDDLVLGTASALRSTAILQRFYRELTKAGLDVTLYATEVEK